MRLEKSLEGCRVGSQGFLRAGRQGHPLVGVGRRLARLSHDFLHDQMDVGAAVAKGVQGGHERLPVRSPPGHGCGVDIEGRTLKLDQWVEYLKMEQARQLAMLQTEQNLDQADHTSAGSGMA